MKKHFFNLLALVMVAMLSASVSSCKNNEEDNGGGSGGGGSTANIPSPVIIDANGVSYKVTSYGGQYGYQYSYDETGKLVKVQNPSTSNWVAEFSNNGKLLVMKETSSSHSITSNISFNANGFISDMAVTFFEAPADKGTEHISCQYNSEGQLISWTQKDSYTGEEDGESYSGSFEAKVTFTWENRKLMKISEESKYDEDGEKGSEKSESTFAYDSRANSARQWLDIMGREIFDLTITESHALAPLGLFGHGPSILPKSYSYKRNQSQSSTSTLTYTMNENGTIHSDNGRIYTYDGETRADMTPWSPEPNETRVRSLRARLRSRMINR